MNELYHHGIKGQKWGVRRYQNYDGTRIIKKGTYVSRVARSAEDPTYDNKKYVSTNMEDHKKWGNYFQNASDKYGLGFHLYDIAYRTTKDIRVAPYTEIGKILADKALSDPKFEKQVIRDTAEASRGFSKMPNDINIRLQSNMSAQTQTGKHLVDQLLKRGYDAIEDSVGWDVSRDPIIILDPDKNLQKTKVHSRKK